MKRLAVATCFVCFVGFTTVALAEDITTLDGKTYRNVLISNIEPDGVNFMHSAGAAKVLFSNLAEPVAKRYGYDAKRFADWQRAKAAASANAAAQQKGNAPSVPTAPTAQQLIAPPLTQTRPSQPSPAYPGGAMAMPDPIAAAQVPQPPQQGQQPPQNASIINQWMSREDFTKAGLSKLNPEEIKALDTWMQRFAYTIVTQVAGQGQADVIETRIDGEFEGWTGETIWKMTNGQIWQQIDGAYRYHYAYGPKVLIYRTSGVYRMRVDGVTGEVGVMRLK